MACRRDRAAAQAGEGSPIDIRSLIELRSAQIAALAVAVFMLATIAPPLETVQSRPGNPPVTDLAVPLAYPLEEFAANTVSGGPAKDGIPSIDEPRLVTAAEAEGFLDPDDIVFGLARNGEARAYPRRILVWHEIVNDRLGHENVSVTYCPLTGTAIGFQRGDTTFGVSGMLVNNNLIMYDRATDSRWPQVLATAVEGPLAGKSLRELRVIWTTWARWRAVHPETRVLSAETGYFRNYDRDPYGAYDPPGGYYAREAPPIFPTMHAGERMPPKAVVVGSRTAAGAVAFVKAALREDRVMYGRLAGTPVAAFYDPRLDTAYVYENPEGRRFTPEGEGFAGRDGRWRAGAIPLAPLHGFDAMWFAWSAFYPDTAVYD